jgi:molybdate transport system substrate-binding protein
MRHRFAVPGMLLVLATGLTTGCTADREPPPAPPAATEPQPAATRAATATGAPAGQVQVYAATSLTMTFTALGKEYEAAYPGSKVVFTFDVGPTLANKIVGGATPDVFVASGTAMKQVTDAGAAQGAPRTLVRDRLVIAVPLANPAKIATLADLGRPALKVALCADQTACGAAARRALDAAGTKITPATVEADGGAALRKVAAGQVDAALVHRTDVTAAGAAVSAIDLADPLPAVDEYPIVALRSGRNPTGAAAFLGLVTSALARRTFTGAGFSMP